MHDEDPLATERKAREEAEALLAAYKHAVEEARNHLMDALALRDDEKAWQSSLDAADDVLGQADEEASSRDEPHVFSAAFLREARHAIRGTLAGAVGHLDLLRSGDTAGSEASRSVTAAYEAATTSDSFIQEFFDIAVALSEAPRIPARPVHLPALVDEVVQLAKPHADRHTIRLHQRVSPEAERSRVDPDGLQEMLEMMLDHAIEAAPERGDVDVSLDRDDEAVLRIEVAHRGDCPMPEDRHFEPFSAGASALPPGLAALPHMTTRRAGSCGVRHPENGGEVLWVHLPQLRPTAEADEPDTTKGEESVPASGDPRVLVVEDEKADREALRTMLDDAGYDVVTATTVDAAVELVKSEHFDAITLDLLLGRHYSMQVLAAARTGKNAEAAVLVLSGARPGNVTFPYPVQGHLQKPVSKRMLLRALRWSHVLPPTQGPVLLVDEGTEVPRALERGLAKRKRRLLKARSASEAIPVLQAEEPAIVLLDPAVPVDDAFIDALEGTPLVLWGQSKESKLQTAARTTVERNDDVDALVGELERIFEEQREQQEPAPG